jgi:protein-tyrosine phosphatase
MEDYLQSNEYIIPMYHDMIDKFLEGGGKKEITVTLWGVKRSSLEAAFDEMEMKYGTIEEYFSERLGISEAQQQALMDLYLVGESSDK